jgi:hypothetical protein
MAPFTNNSTTFGNISIIELPVYMRAANKAVNESDFRKCTIAGILSS